MKTPVLLIIFNRFDTTKQVLAQLRKATVGCLYIYCDGPRTTKTGEMEQLKSVQQLVLDEINWPCEVITNFGSENIGPRLAIGKAISWFFEHEEQGIILEHDCVPAPSFFGFCETLLNHYKNDTRVMHISGDNFQFGSWRGDGSYYFSTITHIWGFATWRRAWKHYDVDMKHYPEFVRENGVEKMVQHPRSIKFWKDIYKRSYEKKIDSWDYQWTFAVWRNNGLSILPNVNLISNVGFDNQALNTKNPNHKLASMPVGEILEIVHPSKMEIDANADAFSISKVFYPTYFSYFYEKILNWLTMK